MFERFTDHARTTVIDAQQQARALGHDWIGTEHLLLALTVGQGLGSIALRELGVDHERVRGAVLKLGSGGRVKDTGPDPQALETIGIDLDAVRRRVEETFGPGALERTRAGAGRRDRRRGHVPFTRRAKTLLELSLREALALRHRHIGTEHILLAFARLPTALGTRVLADLGVNPDAIRRAALDALDGQADSA